MTNSKLNQILRMAGVVAIFAIFREIGRNNHQFMEDTSNRENLPALIRQSATDATTSGADYLFLDSLV